MPVFWQKSKAIGMSFFRESSGQEMPVFWQESKAIGLPFCSKIFGTRNACLLAKR